MTRRQLPLIALLSFVLHLASACGDEEEGSVGESQAKAPYPAFSKNAKPVYVGSAPGGGPSTMAMSWVGSKAIGGGSYGRFVIKESPDNKKGGAEIWANFNGAGDQMTLKGAELEIDSKALFGLAPGYIKFVMDKPLTVNAESPLGTAQSFDLKGNATYEKPGVKGHKMEQTTVKGAYTLQKKDVTVQTPLGPVSGCYQFKITATVPGLFSALGPFEGDLWYSTKLGVVKTNVTKPLAGIGLGVSGSSGFDDLGDGWASVYKVARVGGKAATFTLSTYDPAKKFDADKNTHAKMLLELRWAEADKAKLETKPYVQLRFGTMTGYFPATLVRSTSSLLFPEENGQGYVHWFAFVDQAAKNQSQNGIAYQIKVDHDPSFSPLRVAARIVYKRLGGGN